MNTKSMTIGEAAAYRAGLLKAAEIVAEAHGDAPRVRNRLDDGWADLGWDEAVQTLGVRIQMEVVRS